GHPGRDRTGAAPDPRCLHRTARSLAQTGGMAAAEPTRASAAGRIAGAPRGPRIDRGTGYPLYPQPPPAEAAAPRPPRGVAPGQWHWARNLSTDLAKRDGRHGPCRSAPSRIRHGASGFAPDPGENT